MIMMMMIVIMMMMMMMVIFVKAQLKDMVVVCAYRKGKLNINPHNELLDIAQFKWTTYQHLVMKPLTYREINYLLIAKFGISSIDSSMMTFLIKRCKGNPSSSLKLFEELLGQGIIKVFNAANILTFLILLTFLIFFTL
jgi:hypothetical protein